jgi:protein-tyrosine phosphatase
MRATVLFVCHANICRSPMAERLTRHALADAGPDGASEHRITVASAGTHARGGEAMHPGAAATLRELGVDAEGFASRALTADLVAGAQLVLTATREQRAACVTLCPTALRRIFTIRQFGRLAEAAAACSRPVAGRGISEPDPNGLNRLLEAMARVRGELQPVEPEEDDLADPVNGTADDMRACARTIARSLRPALALIAGTSSSLR